MTAYDRNHNTITTGSHVMVSDIGHIDKTLSTDARSLTAEQVHRGETTAVEGYGEKLVPLDLIRFDMN